MAVSKRRIYDIAKDFNVSSKAMVDIIRDLGFEVKSHSSTVDSDVIKAVSKKLSSAKEEVKKDLDRKKKKELERKKSEEDILRQKKEAEKRIMAELTRSKKKMVKKVESAKIDFRRKKDRKRKRKERVVDTKAVKAAFRQTMSSLGTGAKKKKYQRHEKDGTENRKPSKI